MFRIIKNIKFSNLLYRSYHKKVIDHYENPRNVGSFNPKEKNIGTGLVWSPCMWRCDEITN